VPNIVLQPGKERPVIQRHPWIFSGAIARADPQLTQGAAVNVLSSAGEWLARGTWSAGSQIRARLFTWEPDEPIGADLIYERIQRSIEARRLLGLLEPGLACRLIYAESDGLPGLIVDRYGDYLSVQLLTHGMALRQETVVAALTELLAPAGIYERSDPDMREKEGLPAGEGVLWGEEPPASIEVRHPGGLIGLAQLRGGQKTGAYLDQALNRLRVAAYCEGAEVLDGFCYTGGFTAAAARAGASRVIAVDTSLPALEGVRTTLDVNGLASAPVETVGEDVFRLLRQYRADGRRFDVVILDPPKFASSQGQIERATRGYKDINMIAMQILRPGGVLATFSCSGLVSADLFQKVVFGAALDARRDVQVIERLSQAPDHPLLLTFPEGEYLKGLICRVW
jgi:23S rRNA (cytosine1962-C5)-methyltransferase